MVQAPTCYIAYAQDVMGPVVFSSPLEVFHCKRSFLRFSSQPITVWLISSMPAPQFDNVSFQSFPIFNLHLNFLNGF